MLIVQLVGYGLVDIHLFDGNNIIDFVTIATQEMRQILVIKLMQIERVQEYVIQLVVYSWVEEHLEIEP